MWALSNIGTNQVVNELISVTLSLLDLEPLTPVNNSMEASRITPYHLTISSCWARELHVRAAEPNLQGQLPENHQGPMF